MCRKERQGREKRKPCLWAVTASLQAGLPTSPPLHPSLPPKTQDKELGDKCPPLLSVNFPNLWSTLQLTPSSKPGGLWSTEKETGEKSITQVCGYTPVFLLFCHMPTTNQEQLAQDPREAVPHPLTAGRWLRLGPIISPVKCYCVEVYLYCVEVLKLMEI